MLLMLVVPFAMVTGETVNVAGIERQYTVRAPQSVGNSELLPVVFVLHGGGGSAEQGERSMQFSKMVEKERFLAVYPDGVSGHWNDGSEVERYGDASGVDDLAFFDVLIEQLKEDYPVDARRIYATGISNGAIMAHRLAAFRSEVFAAIAPVCGNIVKQWIPEMKPSQPVSLLVIQGTEDPLIPYEGGPIRLPKRKKGQILTSTDETIRFWVGVDGCEPTPQEWNVPDLSPSDECTTTAYRYSGGRNGAEVILYKVEGGGHTWPGGYQYLPKKRIGNLTRDFSANEVIWRFFKNHPKR